ARRGARARIDVVADAGNPGARRLRLRHVRRDHQTCADQREYDTGGFNDYPPKLRSWRPRSWARLDRSRERRIISGRTASETRKTGQIRHQRRRRRRTCPAAKPFYRNVNRRLSAYPNVRHDAAEASCISEKPAMICSGLVRGKLRVGTNSSANQGMVRRLKMCLRNW